MHKPRRRTSCGGERSVSKSLVEGETSAGVIQDNDAEKFRGQRRALEARREVQRKSGVGVDQRAEHFIAGFLRSQSGCKLILAGFEFDHIGRQVGALATVDRAQVLELKV